MPDPIILPHPRKLYANLCACASANVRAREVLKCLCGATGARGGFLLLCRGDELALAAGSPDANPPPGLVKEALRAWNEHPNTVRSDNTTVDLRGHLKQLSQPEDEPPWVSPSGARFMPRVLTVHRDSCWVPVGIAMLEGDSAASLAPLRRAHVEAVCDALLDSGDVQGKGLAPQPA